MKYYVTEGESGDNILFIRRDGFGLTTDLDKASLYSKREAKWLLEENKCRRMYAKHLIKESATIQVNKHDLFKTK
jgi:hypothetical protein